MTEENISNNLLISSIKESLALNVKVDFLSKNMKQYYDLQTFSAVVNDYSFM